MVDDLYFTRTPSYWSDNNHVAPAHERSSASPHSRSLRFPVAHLHYTNNSKMAEIEREDKVKFPECVGPSCAMQIDWPAAASSGVSRWAKSPP